MSRHAQLPEYVTRIRPGTSFSFLCHKDISCFTECCRLLELALTPYDVLRLRIGTGLHSRELLDNYIIIEHDAGEPFPRFYLTMVDDGRASCVFVSKSGCTVYDHRPAACRAYPLGRAVIRGEGRVVEEHYVLMKENHCRGFSEKTIQDVRKYSKEQGLEIYNRFNDGITTIIQHDSIRKGFIPSKRQTDFYTLALYDIDTLRENLLSDKIESVQLTLQEKKNLEEDERLLLFAIDLLHEELYSSSPLTAKVTLP